MGQYSLKGNKIEKEEGENDYLKFATFNAKGWKKQNDNTFTSKISIGNQQNLDVFCIFVGINGNEISKFINNHFYTELLYNINQTPEDMKIAIKKTFLRMNTLITEDKEEIAQLKLSNLNEEKQNQKKNVDIKEKETKIELFEEDIEEIKNYTGCTACLVLIDENNKKLYFGNLGNTEAIIYGKNEPIIFSSNHRPEDNSENERILNKKSTYNDDCGEADKSEEKNEKNKLIINHKLFGVLNTCRGFGNFGYIKPNEFLLFPYKVFSDEPDNILEYNIKDDDKYIFMGTETILECIDKTKFVDLIKDSLTETLEKILEDNIAYDFYNNDSEFGFDNITCTLIKIKNKEKKDEEKKEEVNKEDNKKEEII